MNDVVSVQVGPFSLRVVGVVGITYLLPQDERPLCHPTVDRSVLLIVPYLRTELFHSGYFNELSFWDFLAHYVYVHSAHSFMSCLSCSVRVLICVPMVMLDVN